MGVRKELEGVKGDDVTVNLLLFFYLQLHMHSLSSCRSICLSIEFLSFLCVYKGETTVQRSKGNRREGGCSACGTDDLDKESQVSYVDH